MLPLKRGACLLLFIFLKTSQSPCYYQLCQTYTRWWNRTKIRAVFWLYGDFKFEGHAFPAWCVTVVSLLISFTEVLGKTFISRYVECLCWHMQWGCICSQRRRDRSDKDWRREAGGLVNCPHLWICINVITRPVISTQGDFWHWDRAYVYREA